MVLFMGTIISPDIFSYSAPREQSSHLAPKSQISSLSPLAKFLAKHCPKNTTAMNFEDAEAIILDIQKTLELEPSPLEQSIPFEQFRIMEDIAIMPHAIAMAVRCGLFDPYTLILNEEVIRPRFRVCSLTCRMAGKGGGQHDGLPIKINFFRRGITLTPEALGTMHIEPGRANLQSIQERGYWITRISEGEFQGMIEKRALRRTLGTISKKIVKLLENENQIAKDDLPMATLIQEVCKYELKADIGLPSAKIFARVFTILFFHPDTALEELLGDIIVRCNLPINARTARGILAICDLIRISDTLQNICLEHSPQANYIANIKEYLCDIAQVQAFLDHQAPPRYPAKIEMHIGIACPANCEFCYRNLIVDPKTGKPKYEGYDAEVRGQKLAPMRHQKILAFLVNECAGNGVKNITISGGLEPLTDLGRVQLVVATAKKLGIETRLYTNAIPGTVDQWGATALLADRVRISVSAATADTYSRIFKVRKETFAHVTEKIRQLVALKKERKSDTKIGLHFLIEKHNFRELKQFIDMAVELGVDFVDLRSDYVGTLEDFNSDEKRELLSILDGIDQQYCAGSLKRLRISYGDRFRKQFGKFREIDRYKRTATDYYKYGVYPFAISIDPFGRVWDHCIPSNVGIREEWGLRYKLGNIRTGKKTLGKVIRTNIKGRRVFNFVPEKTDPQTEILLVELRRMEKDREFLAGMHFDRPMDDCLAHHPFMRFDYRDAKLENV